MAEEKTAIRIDHVSKTYENTKSDDQEYVLKDICLDVKENEFVCVLGPSGCGKSTLLNLIAGFIKPSDGHIEIHGEDIANKSGKAGVVFQEHALMPWLTVKKNIMMGPALHHKSKLVCEEIADKYIQMVGLKGMENYYPKQLSGGMAQRVGIARALANEPDIILMDEPLGALDAMTRENMRQEILKIWQKTRTTVFFITHSVQEAVYLADRVIVLKDGGVDCDVHIDIDRPRNMKSEKFIEYISFFEKKLSNGVVTSDEEENKMKKKGKKSKLEIGLNITSLVVFFGVWEIVAQMNKTHLWFNKNFLPGPSDIIKVAVEYIQNGSLWMHTSVSISRILVGFAIGTVLAVIFGILFVNCKPVEALLSPIFNLLGPIPPYALLPIIIIWFGIGESSKIGLIAYCTFMTMLPYITDGLKNTPPVLIRASTSLGATQFQIFTRVMIPNAMPNLFVGMKVTLAMTFGALMVSEMLGASKGLGYMIINAKQWFKMDDMFLAIIIIGVLYTVMYSVLSLLEKVLFKWKTDVTSAIEK